MKKVLLFGGKTHMILQPALRQLFSKTRSCRGWSAGISSALTAMTTSESPPTPSAPRSKSIPDMEEKSKFNACRAAGVPEGLCSSTIDTKRWSPLVTSSGKSLLNLDM